MNTADIIPIMENAQICLARFDAQTGAFTEQQMLTSGSKYPYIFRVIVENGEPIVLWADSAENVLGDRECHTLYRWMDGEVMVVANELNYILFMDACNGEITYVMDGDGDVSTLADVTAITVSGAKTRTFDNDGIHAVTYASYAELDGEQTLFLCDLSNIYYLQDGEYKTVLPDSGNLNGDLNIVQTSRGTTIIWSEMEEVWNELYSVTYHNGVWSNPVQISSSREKLSSLDVVSYRNQVIGVCVAKAVTVDEATGGYSVGAADLSLFKFDEFTDIALGSRISMDEAELQSGEDAEIYVTVYNNGTTDVGQVTFTVSDTLGTESVQTIEVDLSAGSSDTICLAYSVPAAYAATTLRVSARISMEEDDLSNNAAETEIGMYDLSISDPVVEMINGGHVLKTVVANNSLVDANHVTLSLLVNEEDSEPLQSVVIENIARETYAIAEIMLVHDGVVFDESGVGKVYLKVEADGRESVPGDTPWENPNAPVAPTVKAVYVSSTGKIKVSWNAVDGAAEYKLYRAESQNGSYTLLKTTTATSLTNSTVSPGKTYYYKVVAIAEDGSRSRDSKIVSCSCVLAAPEVTLGNVVSSGKIKIMWDKIEGAVKYKVYYSTSRTGTYTALKTLTSTSLTHASAVVGKTYYYKVIALVENTAANSAFSAVKSLACDLARPTAKVSLNTKGKPVVTWGAVSGAVKYTVYIYDASGTLVKTASTTATKATHSTALKGQVYSYRVVAVASNTAANSAKSVKVSIQSK